ncbi:MAG TPA: hypothetical protein PKD03_15060 [Ignavibacteriaceae bacterium]|nr:hypothetical protein [Ignavibacteriaceae bacterium]
MKKKFFTGLVIFLVVCIEVITLSAQTVTTIDTIYTPDGFVGGPLSATLFLPQESNGVGVVLAHGYTGNRQMLSTWCDTLAAHGYVAMTIDYHDFGDSLFGIYPKPVQEFKVAVEFLRRNSIQSCLTTNKVVGIGFSEGAFHWGQSITWDNDDEFFQTDSTVSDHLDAAILFYGLFDNNNYLGSIIPIDSLLTKYFSTDSTHRITKGNCIVNVNNINTPVLMIHGTIDQVIEFQQSYQLNDTLINKGKICQLVSGEWNHAFDIDLINPPYPFTQEGLIAKDSVLAFLNRHVLSNTFQLKVNIEDSWNIVSIPGLHPLNQEVDTWWSGRNPSTFVFGYDDGYYSVTEVEPGIGYWMEHIGNQEYSTGGKWPSGGINIVNNNPISGREGWNLIGGYHFNVPVSGISTTPPGLQIGQVWSYSSTGGYQVAAELEPGYGY